MIEREVALFSPQMEFLTSRKRETHFEAGIGSGKTWTLAIAAVKTILEYPNRKWILGAKDYPQLSKVLIPEFKDRLRSFGLQEFRHWNFKKSPYPEFTVLGSTVDCASAEAYESAFRAGNYSGAFVDEVDFWKYQAWLALKGRIRKHPEILRSSSSPFGLNHIYEDYHLNPEDFKHLVHMTTYQNTELTPAYVKSLESFYSEKLIKQELEAKRIEVAGNQVYEEFSKKNISEISRMPDTFPQIYFICDYNIAKFCGIFCIHHDGILWVVGELVTRYKGTDYTSKKVKFLYGKKEIYVVGDSTGNESRNVSAKKTNYQIFRDNGLMPLPFKNPTEIARITSVNCNLARGRIVIDKDCKELIKDLELTEYEEKSPKINKKDIERTHMTDALGYADWYFQGIGKRLPSRTIQKKLRN